MGSPIEECDETEKTKYLVEESPMPEGPQYESVVARYRAHEAFCRALGIKVAEYLAMGLGKDKSYFNDWFKTAPLSTFRSTKFLPRPPADVDMDDEDADDQMLVTEPHADSGFITLMTCFGSPGVQVLVDDEYKFIKQQPNHIIVNVGQSFERVTNYTLKAATH